MTLLVAFLSLPFVAWSCLLELLNAWQLRSDIERCLAAIDSSTGLIPQSYVVALIAAEDHRNAYHPGVDPLAMFRALFVRCTQKRWQGASTIEQQFVRVVSGRYEPSLSRKVREQALAIAVARRRTKMSIAAAYLGLAFYGSGCVGLRGLKKRCGPDLAAADTHVVLKMIARLKYPEPLRPSRDWHVRIANRVQYITRRMNGSANRRFESEAIRRRAPYGAPQPKRWATQVVDFTNGRNTKNRG